MHFKFKVFIVLLVIYFFNGNNLLHAQILKNIFNSSQQTSENRATEKADEITNKALDKIEGIGKKKPKKSKAANQTNTTSTTPADTTQPVNNNSVEQTANVPSTENQKGSSQNNEYNSNESFINLKLSSDRIIAGGAVRISGSSIMYKDFKSVTLTITTEDGTAKESRTIALDADGTYSTIWQLNSDGDYIVAGKSSDGKNTVSKKIGVFKPDDIDSVIEPLRTTVTKASDKLKEDIEKVKTTLASKDAEALQKKMDDFTAKKDKFFKQLDEIAAAGKGLGDVEKKYGGLPSSVLKNVSDMTDVISKQTNQVEQAVEATGHKAYDNSVCEYLVMVSEACAAFSTFTNFEGDMSKILKNLAGDKVGRAVAGYRVSSALGSDAAGKASGECASLFVGAATESKALEATFGYASFGGDIVQMCSDGLLKRYCTVMSGELNEKYECKFRNKDKNVWWDYTYTTGAIINLRFQKHSSGGNIQKMKGNIEGNATKFTIFQDAQEIDDYKDAMKGREGLTKFYSVCLHSPVSVPFSAAGADKNMGFGAVARTMVTPACFNIPIDADYDLVQKKLTIYVNDALVDFSPAVCYIYGYIVIAAGIPLVTRVNYPINSVKLTLGKVIQENKTFNVEEDAKNNISINGKGETKIGDDNSDTEHKISFSFNMKSE